MAKWHRAVGCVAMFVVIASVAACGARVTDQQRAALGSVPAADARQLGAAGAEESDAAETPPTAAVNEPSAASISSVGHPSTGTAGTSADNGGATDVGVTGNEVQLGSVDTLSGPIPGLFAGAVTGAQAVIAYENSNGGLFGRKFRLDVRDDQFDTGQNRSQTIDQLNKVFAVLGSFSLYDDAAVDAIGRSGIPDFSIPINQARQRLPNNLSVNPVDLSGGPTGGFEWVQQKSADAVKAVATMYVDTPASKALQQRMTRVAQALGWKFVYERGVQPTETDFTADVVRMRQSGVKAVYLFAVDERTVARIAKAMKQQGFTPAFVLTNYFPAVPGLAGDAVDGWYGFSNLSLFAEPGEAAVNPEVKLFQEWMQKVKPGVKPDVYALYSWALGRLLFQAMEMAGPKLTRAAVIEAVRKIGVYAAGDLVAPMNPGAKEPPTCFVISQIQGGAYTRIDPDHGFDCHGTYLRP